MTDIEKDHESDPIVPIEDAVVTKILSYSFPYIYTYLKI